MIWRALAMAVVMTLAGPAVAQSAKGLPPLKEQFKPTSLAGAALNVADIEKSKDFYVNVLGMKMIQRAPAQGALREYILSFGDDATSSPVLVLTKTDKPVKNPADLGRIIFIVPNGAELARRAAEAGYPPKRIATGTNIITDPEGHRIELFQAPVSGKSDR